METQQPKPGVVENAAIGYGLEDHEATQQDPRVSELRRAESQHVNKSQAQKPHPPPGSLVPSPTVTKKTPEAEHSASNAAVNYGVEGHKANKEDPRVTQMQSEGPPSPINSTSAPSDLPPPTPAAALRSSLKRVSTVPPPPPPPPPSAGTTPTQPHPVVPVPVPVDGDAPKEKQKKTPGINKFTNTDVSFDPSKEFASKTTNTSGQMYSEEESDSASAPPPKPPVPTELNLDECFAFAVELVKRAGAFALMSNKGKERLSYTTKEHEHDLNTRTDNEVEEMLVKEITEKYPSHKIIAEEAVSRSETGQVILTDEPTWIIDPIDGTMNFVHHFPYYCISVALLVKNDTEFGIVYNPPLQELYTARKGQGAKLNDEPMHTSGQEELKNAMILQEYSSGTTAMENANRLIKKTHALRSIGSSAMGLAMVASGVADGFYFFGLHVWDMAAGNLLVTEASGTVMDPAGGEVDIMSRRVLAAATQTLAFLLSAELTQNYPTPRDDETKLVPKLVKDPIKKDFNAQTEFSDSTLSLSSSENSRHSLNKNRN